MKYRVLALPVLVLIVAFPTLASGETPLSLSAADAGTLGFVGAVFDVGLEGASCVALSPDDQYLYVASSIDDAVSVFRRNDSSGRLAFVQVVRDGTGGADALKDARGIAVSPMAGTSTWRARETTL